jgi:large subunit ribosomal protein L29
MKAADLRQLTPQELDARIGELRSSLFGLKIKKATGQLESITSVRRTRRDLARALTVQRDRAQSQGSAAE